MNTVANTVENDNIHLYFQTMYVSRPDRSAKNEYQSLVSPIVLIGGRSRDIHNPTINAVSTHNAAKAKPIASPRRLRYTTDDPAQWSLAAIDTPDATTAKAIAATANHMNAFQVIMTQNV
jgi:hypothetical protein